MITRRFALIFGVVYTAVGLLGVFPLFLAQPPAEPPVPPADLLYGSLIGPFLVNMLHSLVHLAIGAWGIAAWRSVEASVFYARSLAVVGAVLALMAFSPALETIFRLIPLYRHGVWLHAGTALIAAYLGWRRGARHTEQADRRSGIERRVRAVPVVGERRALRTDRRRGYATPAMGMR